MRLQNLALYAALCGATATAATVTLPSTFELDTAQLDVHGQLAEGWTVNPTIDVVGTVVGGLTCANGSQRCLDMDGTGGGSGRVLGEFNGVANTLYTVTFWLSGSQRQYSFSSIDDTMTLDLNGTTTSYTLMWYAPWQQYSANVLADSNGVVRIRFEGIGSDNVGLLLDDINIQASGVPEPSTALLAGIGVLLVLVSRSKSHRKEV